MSRLDLLTRAQMGRRAEGCRNAVSCYQESLRDTKDILREAEEATAAGELTVEAVKIGRWWKEIREREVEQHKEIALAYDRVSRGMEPFAPEDHR